MEKGKVNELFRSKFGNQRLRGFIKTRAKLLPSIKALPSLCKCLTKEIKLLLVFPAMRGRFHDKNAEPSALCVATQSGHPWPNRSLPLPPVGSQHLTSVLAPHFTLKFDSRTIILPQNLVLLLPSSRDSEWKQISFSREKQNYLSLRL